MPVIIIPILVNGLNYTWYTLNLYLLENFFSDKSSSLKCIRDGLTWRERDKSFAGIKLFFRDTLSRSHAHMRPPGRSFRNEWRWNVYASASGNMHGELVGRTFHNAELELNPDFVVYVARIFCVQIIDFHALPSREVCVRKRRRMQFKSRESWICSGKK